MFSFEMEPDGILYVQLAGFWDLAEAKAYIAELRVRVSKQRREQGYALVLVDGRKGEVQSAKVMEAVGTIQSILITQKTDRAAYVVPNSLAKIQARRLASTDQLEVFLSPSPARMWLLTSQSTTL